MTNVINRLFAGRSLKPSGCDREPISESMCQCIEDVLRLPLSWNSLVEVANEKHLPYQSIQPRSESG